MEHWRLIFMLMFSVALGGCENIPNGFSLCYNDRDVGTMYIDTLSIVSEPTSDERKNIFIFNKNSTMSLKLTTQETLNYIYIEDLECGKTIILPKLSPNELIQNHCTPIYPILGNNIEWLSCKIIYVNGKEYTVHKYYNIFGDFYADEIVTFWLVDFGFVLIVLQNGDFYDLCHTLRKVDYNLTDVLAEIKNDQFFSELFTLPPLPPIPQN